MAGLKLWPKSNFQENEKENYISDSVRAKGLTLEAHINKPNALRI